MLPSTINIQPSTLLLLLLTALASAEEGAERFIVRAWQSEDGLPGNVVRSVAQAADGYLWVATAEGLVRFDGVRFSGFEMEPDATLARLQPRALFAEPNGDVWATTTRGGLLRWHAGRLTRVMEETDGRVVLTQVLPDHAGGATVARGTELWLVREHAAPTLLVHTPELDERLRQDAIFWAEKGRRIAGQDALRMHDRAGRRWQALPGGSLTVAEPEGEPVALPGLQPGARINDLVEDREGALWVATGEHGLLQIRERRATMLGVAESQSDHSALALIQDRTDAWWVGTKRGGLDLFEGEKITHFELGTATNPRPVSALCEDGAGTLWAATRDGSVFRRDSAGPFRVAFTDPSKVDAILEAPPGTLWLGGAQGLARWAGGVLTRFGAGEGITSGEVSTLAADWRGELWVGLASGSVFHGREGRFERAGEDAALGGRRISAMLAEPDGTVWATSLGAGLWLWREGRWAHFGTEEGLPDERLTTVRDDSSGHLWLGSLVGILRVEKKQLLSGGRHLTVQRFDRADGLLTRECSGAFQPASWRARDGELWFPTGQGIARMRPERLTLNALPPPVAIEGVEANGRAIRDTTGPGRTQLTFHYTGLSFSSPEKVQFRTRLEGLESDWREAGNARSFTYEAVPPGLYHFQMMAANNDGVWSAASAPLAIRVLPYWWETTWFRVLAVALATGGAIAFGWGVARRRLRERFSQLEVQHAREAERARLAQDLHDELGASLTEISMLASVTAEQPDAAAVRAPLDEIAGKAQAVVGTLDEIVWAVNPRHDTLASLIEYLAAFAGDFLAAAGMTLRLDVPSLPPTIPLATEFRHALYLAVREALHNAVKHSAAREVWLKMQLTPGALSIVVEDNGRGFDPATTSRGDGLRNLHTRMDALGGKCDILTTSGTGTSVQLRLPLPITP